VAAASVLVQGPAGAAVVPAGFSSAGVAPVAGAAAGGGAAGAAAGGAAAGGVVAAGAAGAAAGGIGATTIAVATAGVVAAGAGIAVATGAIGGDGGDEGDTNAGPQQLPLGLSGIVYARFIPNPAAPTGPGINTDPVAGAVVSTSLDGTTATTGGDGRFSLITQTRADPCTSYTVTIRAAGQPTYSVTATWGNAQGPPFTFTLSPPGPNPFKSNVCP
jgi:hypothetical protein